MQGLTPVRFSFRLGELHLCSWRPRFVATSAPTMPEPQAPPPQALPPQAAGIWWQQAPLDRFELGPKATGGWIRYVPWAEKLFYVSLEGDFENYLAGWSSKARYNLKRSVRKIQEQNGNTALEIFSEPGQMDAFLRQAAAISKNTYQSRLLNSGLSYDEAKSAAMSARAARGEGRGYLLRDQGEAIAFAWCAGYGDRLTYEVVGYQEAAAASSPGSVLLYLILEDLFALQRFRIFDFGVGDAPYKRQFSTGVLEFADVYFLTRTLRHRLLVHGHWWLGHAVSSVGAWLERHGLKAKVKRLMRRMRQ